MSSVQDTSLGLLVRTLMAAGYELVEANSQPSHVELFALGHDELGIEASYLFALTDSESYTQDQIEELQTVARSHSSRLVLISRTAGPNSAALDEILTKLGGAIPSWRALTNDYSSRLDALGRNQLPPGEAGEAWQLFEEAVSDGLEFIFGRRVTRLGAKHRGSRVPDCVCSTPDQAVLLVDAKAASSGFDVSADSLRPLKEYAAQQVQVQRGGLALSGCLIVSSVFQQTTDRLTTISGEFLSDVGVPLGFMTTSTLGEMVGVMRDNTRVRNSIRWRRVFCVSGPVILSRLRDEMQVVSQIQLTKR